MTKPILALSTATDAEINAAVAEHICGVLLTAPGSAFYRDYLHDSNAVLPLLERHPIWAVERLEDRLPEYRVSINHDTMRYGWGRTFCRSACIALLKASGKVEVIE